MKKYLLACGGGATFLCLFAKILPVQASVNYKIADDEQALIDPENLANFNISSTQNASEFFDGNIVPNVTQAEFIVSQQQDLPVIKQQSENRDLGQTIAPTSPVLPVSKSSQGESSAQVTSVSQLSDVKTTDWAFQALQSLVERYGCILRLSKWHLSG